MHCMLGRLFAVVTPCLALLAVVDCGSTTSVSAPSTFDAGCADPSVVLDAGPDDMIPLPEAGAPECPTGVCNYQAQTGCPANQACRPQFTTVSPDVSPGCEAAGTGKSGATCASGGDCAVGYFCASDGACHKQCCHGDWSACDPGESCFRELQVKAGGVITDSGMELCFPVGSCDLLDPNSCAAGLACALVDPTGGVACVPASKAQPGDVCSAGSCAAGAICVESNDGEPSRCRAFCSAEICGASPCAPGQGTCVRHSRDPAGVGECTPG
jgi:hypothetical protein